jgi:multidrug efflux pump subunit AcrA (membrane-fusion protein)
LAVRENAKINLDRTTVYAPVNGYVTNLVVDEGDFADAGKAVGASRAAYSSPTDSIRHVCSEWAFSPTDCRIKFERKVMPTTNLFDLSGRVAVVMGGTAVLAEASPWAWLKPELQSPFWHVMRRRTSESARFEAAKACLMLLDDRRHPF